MNGHLQGLFADDSIREKLGLAHEDYKAFKADVQSLNTESEAVVTAFCWGLFMGQDALGEIDATDQKQVDAFNRGVRWNAILGKSIMNLLIMWLTSLASAAWLPIWVQVLLKAILGGLQTQEQAVAILKITMRK